MGSGDMVPTFFSRRKLAKLMGLPALHLRSLRPQTRYLDRESLASVRPALCWLSRTMDPRHTRQQCLVGSRFGCRPAANQMLMQYFISYLGKGVVRHLITRSHRQLESPKQQRVARAVLRRHRKSHEIRFSAANPHCSVLWERRVSHQAVRVEACVCRLLSLFPRLTKEQDRLLRLFDPEDNGNSYSGKVPFLWTADRSSMCKTVLGIRASFWQATFAFTTAFQLFNYFMT